MGRPGWGTGTDQGENGGQRIVFTWFFNEFYEFTSYTFLILSYVIMWVTFHQVHVSCYALKLPMWIHINSKHSKLSPYLLTAALSVAQQSRWTVEIAYETQGVTVWQYGTAHWKNSSWKQDEGALFQMSRCIFMAAEECFLLYKHRASTPPSQTLLLTSHDRQKKQTIETPIQFQYDPTF